MTIDGQKLSAINAKDSTFGANLGKNLVNNMASATMNSALTGAKLEDSLRTALMSAVISAGAGQAASTIGDMTKESPAVKALAHALAGCVVGAAGAGSQGCQSGAIGAVVGELAAQWVNPTGDPTKATQTLEVVKVLSAAAGALTGDGSAQSVNTAVMTGVNAAQNNYLAHAEAQRLAELKQKQLLGQCDTSCQKQIDWLNAVDAARNQKLNACASSNSADCSSARSELRTAAAEYIRLNAVVPSVSTVYQNERNETLTLARQTMEDYTIWNVTKGVGGSVLDGAKALGGAAYTGFKALLGNEQAQQDVKAGLGATWDFVKEPGNWPELMGAMSPAQREQLAQAYERGDGKTVASMLGEQLTNLPGAGGAGTIKTVVKTVDKAQDVTKLAVRGDVEKVVQVPVGAKGNWDPSINTGTTGNLAPKTAYMLDNGHAYITDGAGRVKAVEGPLSLDKMDRTRTSNCVQGRVDVWVTMAVT